MTRYAPQWLQSGSYSAAQDRRLMAALWPAPASSGGAASPIGGAMTVQLAAGQAAVPSPNNTGSTLCTWDAPENVTLAAAPGSGTNRYDVITCHPRGADLDGGANNDFIIDIVQGTAAASPAVPAVPAGQIALWQVYVPGGSASVTAGNLADVRPGGLAIATAVNPTAAGRGTLAQASAASNSSSTTTNVNWFSSPAVTVDGTRRLKVSFTGNVNTSGSGENIALRLMDGASILQVAQARLNTASGPGQYTVSSFWQGVPAAGTHTYTINVQLIAGTGPVVGAAGGGPTAFVLVEDIGT